MNLYFLITLGASYILLVLCFFLYDQTQDLKDQVKQLKEDRDWYRQKYHAEKANQASLELQALKMMNFVPMERDYD